MPHPLERLAVCAIAMVSLCTGCIGSIEEQNIESNVDPASRGTTFQNGGEDGDTDAPEGSPSDADDGNAGGGDVGEASGSVGDVPAAPGNGGEEPPQATPTAAKDLLLREVAVYQGVKIPIAQGVNDIVDRKASVVAGRPALLRVFVDPGAGFVARKIVARLTLSNPGAAPLALDSELQVSAASRDETLTSTFNFDLAGDLLRTDTEFSVALFESGAAPGDATTPGTHRVPELGLAPLGAKSAGTPFRVVVVPVRYNGDGSGRLPRLGAAEVEGLRNYLFPLMPTGQLEVTLGAPMDFNSVIGPDGSGWSQLLDQCLSRRSSDGADVKTYYYCMFNPAIDFGAYCGGSCVAGLGPVPQARDTFNRAAIGLGFGDAAGTMAHELGHALGRPHAPCGGVAGPDPGFPYAGGRIGSWGYDLLSKKLFSPADSTDLMGYCSKTWISDYNYDLIFKRFQAVLAAPQLRSEPVDALSIVVDADLSLHVGSAMRLFSQPAGELVSVKILDDQGHVLETVSGTFVAVSHVSGGILYVPRPSAGAASLDVEGFGSLAL